MWSVIARSTPQCETSEKAIKVLPQSCEWYSLIKEVIFKEDKIAVAEKNIWNGIYCGH